MVESRPKARIIAVAMSTPAREIDLMVVGLCVIHVIP
jgi:hypothetical protein